MDTKTLGRVRIKDADLGQVQAVFSTLGVVDLDGDVTEPGAFVDGAKVRISAYGHASWGGALPVGKGVIHTAGDEAVLDGQFFLDTVAGRDTFTVVKELGELQEWSYGFDVVEAGYGIQDDREVRFLKSLAVHEVSPVLLGAAGPGRTRTIGAKSALKFTDEGAAVVSAVQALRVRAAEVVSSRHAQNEERARKGLQPNQKVSADFADLLVGVKAELVELAAVLGDPLVSQKSIDNGLTDVLGELALIESNVRKAFREGVRA